MIEALLSAGQSAAEIAQSLINARTQKRNVEMTNRANMELAQYQYSKDLEMWNRGNQYNSPTAQMERLKAAGLNPNLVYGGGNTTGNQAGQLPKFNAPTMNYNYKPPVDITNILGAFQDFRIKQAQYDNLKAQRKAIEENTQYKDLAGKLLSATTPGKTFSANMDARLKEAAVRALGFYPEGESTDGTGTWKYDPRLQGWQLDFLTTRNRAQSRAIDKMDQEIDLLDKKNEWYVTQLFSKLGLDALGTLLKAVPAKRAGGFFKSKAPAGTNFEQYRPRYNSPTSWKQITGSR